MHKYGIIPEEDVKGAEAIYEVITIPAEAVLTQLNVVGGTVTDLNGQEQTEVLEWITTKIVEHSNWGTAQTNFLNARWTAFFNTHPNHVDDFIKISLTGLDLGDRI